MVEPLAKAGILLPVSVALRNCSGVAEGLLGKLEMGSLWAGRQVRDGERYEEQLGAPVSGLDAQQ